MRHMEKSTTMLVRYLEVSRALVSWPIKAKRLAPIPRMGVSINQLPQDVLAEKLASPYQQQDASIQSVRRYVPDSKLLEATLDAIVVERPSPTDEAPQHLCLDIGYDYEPSRHVLLERGYIAHIRSIGEEKDEVGQRRYPARRWVVERTLVGYRSVGRSWCATRRKPPSLLPLVSLLKPSPSYAPLAPSWRPGASGHGFPDA